METIPRELLGKYRLDREIGSGGMARVFQSTLLTFNKTVAIKILHRRLAEDKDYIRRFHQEAQAAIKLPLHPHVAFVHDSGRVKDLHFIVMEFVEGTTLKHCMQSGDIGSVERALAVAEQILEALKFIQEHGIIHRDVKPSNVMINTEGNVKLTDFGVARKGRGTDMDITRVGEVIGTPEYMSPEQAAGGRVDARSDVFSVGTILYEMLTGSCPFAAPTAMASLYKVMKTSPEPLRTLVPEIPEKLSRLTHRALQKDLRHRFANARQMLEDLRLVRRSLPREVLDFTPGRIRKSPDSETVLTRTENDTSTVTAFKSASRPAAYGTIARGYKIMVVALMCGAFFLVYWGHIRLIEDDSGSPPVTVAVFSGDSSRPVPVPGGLPEMPRPYPIDIESGTEAVGLIEPAVKTEVDGPALSSEISPPSLPEGVIQKLLAKVKTMRARGDYLGAIGLLEREVSVRVNDPRLIICRGWQYCALGLYNEALGEVARVLAVQDDYADAHLLQGASLLGKYLYEEKIGIGNSHTEYYKAESEINRALILDPSLIDGYFFLGDIYLYREWYDRARNSYLEVLSRDNTHTRAHHKLGVTYLKLNQPHMAKGRIERAIALNPNFKEAYIDHVRVLLALNDAQAAEREARELIAKYPDEAQVRMVFSEALLSSGRYNEALDELDRAQERGESALETDKARSKVYFLKAFNQRTETNGLKVHWYQEALKAYPENKLARENLAAVYTQMGIDSGEPRDKERWYRKALEVDPDCLEARLNLRHVLNRANARK